MVTWSITEVPGWLPCNFNLSAVLITCMLITCLLSPSSIYSWYEQVMFSGFTVLWSQNESCWSWSVCVLCGCERIRTRVSIRLYVRNYIIFCFPLSSIYNKISVQNRKKIDNSKVPISAQKRKKQFRIAATKTYKNTSHVREVIAKIRLWRQTLIDE